MPDEIMVPKEYLRQLQNAQEIRIIIQPYTSPLAKAVLIVGVSIIAVVVFLALANF